MSSDPFDLLIANLRGTIPMSTAFCTKEGAYEQLKRISGEDWGYDADAWYSRKEAILKRMDELTAGMDPKKTRAEIRKLLRSRKTGIPPEDSGEETTKNPI